MTPEQLKSLSDADLDQLSLDVAAERDHRFQVAAIPQQIERLSKEYQELTGKQEPPVQAAERGVGLASTETTV